MNPFTPYLYGIPGLISIVSAIPKHRKVRVMLIIIANAIYWMILPKSVQWAYTHPFNPNDGAALSFSALFGGLIGLITLVLPLHFGTKFMMWILRKTLRKQ
jgi:hypothetical protein